MNEDISSVEVDTESRKDGKIQLEFTYLCKDGVWRGCNQAAITHMLETLKMKDLKWQRIKK